MTAQLVDDLIQARYDGERSIDVGRVAGNALCHAPEPLHVGFDGPDDGKQQAEKHSHGDYHDRADYQQHLPERGFLGGES
ncbi:MAG TPA: hypothetical protein VJ757_16085 [Pseudonocardiaceae bacterium]|nr:hypothetical protein [Pseudonocardiaceae bacterium]